MLLLMEFNPNLSVVLTKIPLWIKTLFDSTLCCTEWYKCAGFVWSLQTPSHLPVLWSVPTWSWMLWSSPASWVNVPVPSPSGWETLSSSCLVSWLPPDGLCLRFQPLAQSAQPDSNPASGEIERLSSASYLPHRVIQLSCKPPACPSEKLHLHLCLHQRCPQQSCISPHPLQWSCSHLCLRQHPPDHWTVVGGGEEALLN